ncbi:restriction endonuclease subunit S [Moraxella catarrhalis]|uniref:restriction endonuclease subunit S n=1 Tax=Moraxella catarrhalis TaxID=480 RepID=UPI000802C82B|nr:restriction endonuclease subunit S [Moraxella catarrhalis]OBX43769.1 restriction endonuclease subunit S [Moraxella catarrhalis]
MNVMINQLLQGQAVEWQTLGEVLVRTKGTKITAGKMKELHKSKAPIKIFAGGKTFALVDFDDIPQKDINHKPSIIVKSRGIIEFEYYDKPFSHKNEMWAYHSQNPNINIKFIYYFLKQNEPYFQKIGSKMQMPQIATPDTDKFKIPIPPLSVQSQIVQILDTFTELTAELSMRQKQYQYYRDFLLSEHELAKVGFEWKSLGEVVLPTNNIKWHESDLSYRYIDLSSVDKDNNNIGETLEITSKNAPSRAQKIVKKDDVIFATTRPTQMRSALIPPNLDGQIASTGYCILRANQNEVLPKWIYYNLQIDEFKIYLQGKQSGTAYPAISDGLIKQFQIPIPPLSVQSQIVAILDTFDTLTQSISEGLPKEIKLRQKQYEYYRERLLNFKATI